jgi:hypothetical protein
MLTAPKSAYFLLVSTTAGVKHLHPPGGVDAPHRHLGLREQLPGVEAEEAAPEGDRHLLVLTFGPGPEPLLQLIVLLLRELPVERGADRLLEILPEQKVSGYRNRFIEHFGLILDCGNGS